MTNSMNAPIQNVRFMNSHSRAVRVQLVQLLGDQFGGRAHEVGDFGRVEAVLAERLRERSRFAERQHVGLHGGQAFLQIGKDAVGLVERLARGDERGGQLADRQLGLVDQQTLVRHGGRERRRNRAQLREASVDGGNRIAEQAVRVRPRCIGRALHRSVEGRSRLGHRAREIARLPVRRVESVERRLRVGRTLVERIGDRDERLFGRIAFGQRLSRLAHLGGQRLALLGGGAALRDGRADARLRLARRRGHAADGAVRFRGRFRHRADRLVHGGHRRRGKLRGLALQLGGQVRDGREGVARRGDVLARPSERVFGAVSLGLSFVGGRDDPVKRGARLGYRLHRARHFDRRPRLRCVQRVVRLRQRSVDRAHGHIAHRRDEGGVDRLVKGARARVGDLRRHGPRLLVHVVGQLGLHEVAGGQRQQPLGEVFGYDERSVARARIEFVHGSGAIDERPVELLVFAQLLHDHIAHVQLAGQLAGSAGVLVHHAHAQVARVVVGVPEADHVVPGIH